MAAERNKSPFILVVDDEPDEQRSTISLGLADRAEFAVLHPRDATLQNLEDADLVLVDFRLDNWSERDDQPCLALQPMTGMALTAVLREHVDRSDKDRLTAFALHSGYLDEVRGRLPSASAQHVVASLNNLEWVFFKNEDQRWNQMLILAEAVQRLPRKWPDGEDESASELKALLGMDEEAPYFGRCWREVEECQPPIHDLRGGGHGVLLVRWILHQIIPYPTFLWEEHWVAARLRVPVDALRTALAEENELSKELRGMQYSGVLAGFLGKRWWRGALEDYAWNLAGGGAGDATALREALGKRAGRDLGWVEPNPPVVCLNENFEPTGNFKSPSDALRLRPDHWPRFADAAWMDVETVRNDPFLKAMVDPLDQDRIGGEEEA